jgi:hypothetical protein
MLTKGYTYQVLNDFKKYVIKQSRSRLTKGKKNVDRKLYNSIDGDVKVNPNSISLSFSMEDYGYYQDRGVKGKTSTYPEIARYGTLAKFGSGKGKKGGLSKGIKEWVRKRRFQFTDNKGRFMSYNSTAFLITRSIWNKGLKPSLFFTKPFEQGFKKLPEEIIEAYGLDVEEFLQFTLNGKK